jgi:hypothetical protein
VLDTAASAAAGERSSDNQPISFQDLVQTEHKALTGESSKSTKIAAPSTSNEPWVRFTSRDYFGLALSGGGIRSATFNLGLLEALDEKKVLNWIDYLSTVSGGGYVGGFWSTWLLRKTAPGIPPVTFPNAKSNSSETAGGLSDPREPPPIRHLREYSRFIIPRVGFKEFETWNAIITVLGGVLPSIATSLCLLALVFDAAHRVGEYMVFGVDYIISTLWFCAATVVIQSWALGHWKRNDLDSRLGSGAILLFGAAFSSAAWYLMLRAITSQKLRAHGLDPYVVWNISLVAFIPAIAWGAAALVIVAIRAFLSHFIEDVRRGSWSALVDRAASLCLAPGIVAAGLAGVWELGRYLESSSRPAVSLGISAAGTTVAGSLLFSLRNWLAKRIADPGSAALGQRIASNLKPFIPRILSSAVVVGLVLVAILIVQGPWASTHPSGRLWVFGGELLAALVLFDPLKVGMHDFYRRRIRDCFLVAAGTGLERGEKKDDPTLSELREALERQPKVKTKEEGSFLPGNRVPVHLVCCTANNLAGDTLKGLYRGARSAVLSPYGVSLGGVTARLDDLRLSYALTASAAAFNSQMGQLSMDWGPAVAFAMSTFNLRLGLWVPHPSNPNRKQFTVFPGAAFFKELFGMTDCDPVPDDEDVERLNSEGYLRKQLRRGNYLHLSDGGHFENLAIYELIRRHCRYIIVSDCGADEDIKFDDLGNALRRVREDFGVQVELDVEPLRPGTNGNSVQHAVVGTIHYDGIYGSDKGTILYIKPTITGDEPADVLQHHSRYPHFPHDTTAEQFYNEAQWESYRCLGEHVGRSVFAFLDKPKPNNSSFVENLFLGAGECWRPALRRQDEIYSALTERCRGVENDIRQNAPGWLRDEFFPEVAYAVGEARHPEPNSPEDATQAVYFLMLVIQIMEDVWVAAELDKYWSHPMSQGWMAYFHRWAATPSFRTWWPILRPLYSNGLREFVKERFEIRLRDPYARPEEANFTGPSLALGTPTTVGNLRGLAVDQCVRTFGPIGNLEQPAVDYSLTLLRDGVTLEPVQVGFLSYDKVEGSVSWHCDDLFVPFALVGGGIMARFLDGLIKYFKLEKLSEIIVTISIGGSHSAPNRADRWALVETINFYKSRGFVYVDPLRAKEGTTKLRLDLNAVVLAKPATRTQV